ncbi:MAG: hypothetical protein ACUVUR_05340 [bacterium]
MQQKRLVLMAVLITLFITAGCNLFGGNKAPNKPQTPVGPEMRATGIAGNYTARTTDPENDSIAYQFNWDSAADTSAWSSFVKSGDSITMVKTWNTPGSYQITVRARDIKGNISEWSPALTVTVRVNQIPATPGIPAGPGSGIPGRGYYFYATTTDPDNDMVQFRFYWGQGDTSDWGGFVASGATDSAFHTFTIGGLYQIMVQARDELGGESFWSEPLNFVVTDTAYPYTIALTWNEDPRDLDAHIWTPDVEGDSWHIYFGRKGFAHTVPYCSLDVDDVTSFGPEHITITRAYPGEYIYAVHHWSGDSTITTSGAVVRVYHYGDLIRTFNVPGGTASAYWWWHVFKLNAVTGEITELNLIDPDPPLPWTMDARK